MLKEDNSQWEGNFIEIKYDIRHFNNRADALTEEYRLVGQYRLFNYKNPPLQKRPAPGTLFLPGEW